MQPKFKEGDTVELKSGSPKMVINRIILQRNMTANMRGFTDDFEGQYECKWFNGVENKSDNFHENTLKLAE